MKNRKHDSVALTCLKDIHSPQGTTYEAMVSTALPIALALIHDGVCWRRIIAAEALPSVLDPGKSVPLVLLDAPPDALGRCVVSRLPQVLWQQARLPVLNALSVPT